MVQRYQQPARRVLNGAALLWVTSVTIGIVATIVSILPSQETSGTPAAPVYSEHSLAGTPSTAGQVYIIERGE